jgi:hypothetical protein
MRKYLEQLIWTSALIVLFFMDTSNDAVSLCVFRLVGFDSCPGCGLAHSIHYVLHFSFRQSFNEHILGIPATAGILYAIINPFFHQQKQNNLKWINNK